MPELMRIYPNDNMSFNIDNLSDINASDLVEFDIKLEKEGEPIYKDKFELDIEPGRNYWYFLEPEEDLSEGEYVYTIDAKTKKAYDDIKKGTSIAHSQKIFTKAGGGPKPKKTYKPIEVEENDMDITFKGENFVMDFSKVLGGLVSLSYDGEEYLSSKPLITFWRPLTDTDILTGLQFEYAQFLAATVGQQHLPEKYYFQAFDDGSYGLTFVYRYPLTGRQESAVFYFVYPNGDLRVESTYSGLATIDIMPTFAMNFKLNKSLDAIRYYGYGPDENYIDTTEGLDLGVYETTVRRNFKKNERPQETGNRTGVRWAEVYNPKSGKGLRFTSNKGGFEFSALPYNDIEIEAANTKDELPKFANTNVRIASRVAGIGNGEFIPDWAFVDAGEMLELDFTISPCVVEKASKKAKRLKKETKKAESEKKQEIKREAKAERAEAKKEKKESIREAKATEKQAKAEAKKELKEKKSEAKAVSDSKNKAIKEKADAERKDIKS